MEKAKNFTLSFFDERYRAVLELCGSKSGRDVDKAASAGITPLPGVLAGTTAFAEARLIIECKKIYCHDFDPKHFLDATIGDCYPECDYHRAYTGEVINCLTVA
jgi:flavin reductase (DIM6/NTAB) family NADH-FMN oxidoreductase RutF